jgi:hypothetical protein
MQSFSQSESAAERQPAAVTALLKHLCHTPDRLSR